MCVTCVVTIFRNDFEGKVLDGQALSGGIPCEQQGIFLSPNPGITVHTYGDLPVARIAAHLHGGFALT